MTYPETRTDPSWLQDTEVCEWTQEALPDLRGDATPSAAGPSAPMVLTVSIHSFIHLTTIYWLSQALF